MSLLSLALYCEGNTDERFLPPVLEKTTKRILDEYKRNNMQVLVRLIEVERKKRGESILEAAHKAGRTPLTGESAQASLRGRPRGRLGLFGSGKGCLRGRPRGRFGSACS